MRSTVYDALSIGLLLGSTFFFYQVVSFLAQKDYLAGLLVMVIGFVLVRVGVEISRLAILIRRESPQQEAPK